MSNQMRPLDTPLVFLGHEAITKDATAAASLARNYRLGAHIAYLVPAYFGY